MLVVGHIGKAHGIRGEVLVTVRTDEPERRFVPGAVFTTTSGTLTLEALRWHQGRIIAQFSGVPDRNAAEELRGTELQVDSSSLVAPTDPDEFHDHQLVGLRVVSLDGEELGSVARIDHAPSSDLLVLDKSGGGTALIPFVAAMVPTVDLAGGRVIVDLPPGLLDL
ncbi:ribosome maturation factor RimM [Actinoplanes sp. NPDC049265]|uniref:ribosome maturation factor RimM n=1 Tax=Actinoplanes sp. NPDC049265 TaxID=3363902 RepID=UPI003723FA75